jgi:hypothetical protein
MDFSSSNQILELHPDFEVVRAMHNPDSPNKSPLLRMQEVELQLYCRLWKQNYKRL